MDVKFVYLRYINFLEQKKGFQLTLYKCNLWFPFFIKFSNDSYFSLCKRWRFQPSEPPTKYSHVVFVQVYIRLSYKLRTLILNTSPFRYKKYSRSGKDGPFLSVGEHPQYKTVVTSRPHSSSGYEVKRYTGHNSNLRNMTEVILLEVLSDRTRREYGKKTTTCHKSVKTLKDSLNS